MKCIITMIIFFISIINYIIAQNSIDEAPIVGVDCPSIPCGKNKPSKASDCTKYGTDSGMLCCWYSESNTSTNGLCTLLSENKAKQKEIDGDKTFIFGKYKYWNCGNKSFYISSNIILIIISLFMLC